jgi:hypothetical protein
MLDALGNIGDFLGGVGVVITLIYLAAQIRQNTTSSRTESYQAAVAAISDWTRHVGTSPASSRIVEAGSRDFAALSPEERVQFNLIMAALVRNLENIHFQFMHGAIDESTWSGWANRTHSLLEPGGARAWWRTQEAAYSPEFRRFVDEQKPSDDLPESIVRRDAPARDVR